MSDTIIISVENLSKRYRLGTSRSNERYTALRDVIADKAKSLFRRNGRVTSDRRSPTADDFWALKDVSFDVKQGEVLGIIGRNGAGKSTLLKILSRITEPTEGKITLRGRVASLLEVGTGFHPELTGRENIFLNGAILGMGRAEIKKKFDEIVAFAETEKFLDTPVKRYSSGMYVRLAFAVAAHLEPEILIVDEVLAVGDAEFQKKCLGKMREVAQGHGRTVLFVSHNMGAVRNICSSVAVIDAGRVTFVGPVADGISRYLSDVSDRSGHKWVNAGEHHDDVFRIDSMKVVGAGGEEINRAVTREERVYVEARIHFRCEFSTLDVGVMVVAPNGTNLFLSYALDDAEGQLHGLSPGRTVIRAELPISIMNKGTHTLVFVAAVRNRRWIMSPEQSPVRIAITVDGSLGPSDRWQQDRIGLIAPQLRWCVMSHAEAND